MNRHPYGGGGGGYDASRRGGSPQSPGQDRPRFSRPPGRGGRGGGRGGGPSYYDAGDYNDNDYNHPPQGYNMNGSNHNDSYYYQGQNQHMGPPPVSSFSSTPTYGSYDQHGQGYGNTAYEDKSPPSRGQYNPANRGGKRPPVRKERDDKVHDSLIEERIQRERPCRTLFIRNVKV
ncbi:hypothetical protein Clacol_007688 [Clathrus columnatus]|uniref:Uncharacterized protein n=1 Tax=Clathrus columnatus TaxID=1419009 RepID=A0AAV5AL58_9AGAM|nr:hypothetical protein Clacol_007688 [Clathrus columnatus]